MLGVLSPLYIYIDLLPKYSLILNLLKHFKVVYWLISTSAYSGVKSGRGVGEV